MRENYISIKKLTLLEFLDLPNQLKGKFGKSNSRKYLWIKLIESGNLTCPVTNKKVDYCSYDYIKSGNLITYHYNFYSIDGELFTIDHKIPISKGGHKSDVSNLQPMIGKENWKKSDKLIYL